MRPRVFPANGDPEPLISALVPKPISRQLPLPAPLPALPRPQLPAEVEAGSLLLAMARVDRSGRLSNRELFEALGWQPGHRVDIDVVDGVLVIASTA